MLFVFLIYKCFFFQYFHHKVATDIVIIGGLNQISDYQSYQDKLKDVETIRVMDNEIFLYSPHWVRDFPEPISHHAGVISRNQLVVCGGYATYPKNKCKRFNFETKSWTSMPSMIKTRAAHAMVENEQNVFAFGGDEGGMYIQEQADAEVLKNDNWSRIAKIPKAIAYHCAVKLDENTIFVIGGQEKEVSW